jgi:hypothetical protein
VMLRPSGAAPPCSFRISVKPRIPRAANVFTGPAEMQLTRMFRGPELEGHLPRRLLEHRLGAAHHVVARHRSLRGEVAQRHDAATVLLEQGQQPIRHVDVRVCADLERELKAPRAASRQSCPPGPPSARTRCRGRRSRASPSAPRTPCALRRSRRRG